VSEEEKEEKKEEEGKECCCIGVGGVSSVEVESWTPWGAARAAD